MVCCRKIAASTRKPAPTVSAPSAPSPRRQRRARVTQHHAQKAVKSPSLTDRSQNHANKQDLDEVGSSKAVPAAQFSPPAGSNQRDGSAQPTRRSASTSGFSNMMGTLLWSSGITIRRGGSVHQIAPPDRQSSPASDVAQAIAALSRLVGEVASTQRPVRDRRRRRSRLQPHQRIEATTSWPYGMRQWRHTNWTSNSRNQEDASHAHRRKQRVGSGQWWRRSQH